MTCAFIHSSKYTRNIPRIQTLPKMLGCTNLNFVLSSWESKLESDLNRRLAPRPVILHVHFYTRNRKKTTSRPFNTIYNRMARAKRENIFHVKNPSHLVRKRRDHEGVARRADASTLKKPRHSSLLPRLLDNFVFSIIFSISIRSDC